MQKKFLYIPIIITLALFSVSTVRAQEVAGVSASIKNTSDDTSFDYRIENLRNYFEKFNSPLAPYAGDFVAEADSNGLDYRLVPAISGVESTFAKYIPSNSYNAYGWAGGEYRFDSWPNSIATVSSTLKTEYIDKGAPTITQIAKRYAPPSTTWGGNVKYFVSKIDTLPLSFDI